MLHRDPEAEFLNELWVLGRYHGQYHLADGSPGDDDGWDNRRFRLGTQMRLFGNLTLHAQSLAESDPDDFDPEKNGFTELWAGWRFDESFMLTIGQQKHRFTHDRNVSSRYINTLDRAQLTNMFRADYTPAVTGSGRIGPWSYYAGVFSNATGRDMGKEFTEFDSGYSLLGSVTRDPGNALGTDSAFLNVSAVSSDARREATNLNYLDTGIASTAAVAKAVENVAAAAFQRQQAERRVRAWLRVPHGGGSRRSGLRRYSWAVLLQRPLGIEVLVCPECSGSRRVLAASHDPASIARVLGAMGLSPAAAGPPVDGLPRPTDGAAAPPNCRPCARPPRCSQSSRYPQ